MPDPAPFDANDLTVQAWRFLDSEMVKLGTPLQPVFPDIPPPKDVPSTFMSRVGYILSARDIADSMPSSTAERLAIIDQAELLFKLYPHMPYKTDRFHFVHPQVYLDNARAEVETATETQFHAWMLAAFSVVRDAHTVYGLPSPYRGLTAFLPFQMTGIIDPRGFRRFIVSRIMNSQPDTFGHPTFDVGAEIIRWAGVPIEYHVLRTASRLPGGNPSADFARATLACTIRPLAFCTLPFEEEMPFAEIVYTANVESKELHAIKLPWGVVRFPPGVALPTKSFSMSPLNDELSRGRRAIYPKELWDAHDFKNSTDLRIVSTIPEAFEFQFTGGPRDRHPIDLASLSGMPGRRFGYLRIKAFSDGSDAPGATDRLVEEARRILTLLDEVAPDGLIIDIRGNPGGDIEAAERMLQMLTPNRITPENFHFANSQTMLFALRSIRDGRRKKRLSKAERNRLEETRLELEPWLGDADAVPYPVSRERLTSGQPLTSPDACNDIGQVYHGRVLLLTDGFTYSAADIFAAGFADHEIGYIYGLDGATGGGGANVWNHSDLLAKFGSSPELPLKALPPGVSMRLAIRRSSRVGRNAGQPVEDLGVNVLDRYVATNSEEVTSGFPGMIGKAVSLLVKNVHLFRLTVSNVRLRSDGGVSLDVRSRDVTSLRFSLDDEVAAERPIESGATRHFVVRVKDNPEPSILKIEGFSTLDVRTAGAPRLVTVLTVDLHENAGADPESDADESVSAKRRRHND